MVALPLELSKSTIVVLKESSVVLKHQPMSSTLKIAHTNKRNSRGINRLARLDVDCSTGFERLGRVAFVGDSKTG